MYFIECSLTVISLMFLLMIRLGVLERKTTEIKCHFHCITSRVVQLCNIILMLTVWS